MTIHQLKTINPFFDDIFYQRKKFEFRKNDRNFKIGDILELKEYDNNNKIFLSRKCNVIITYILENFEGIDKNYCILDFEPIFFYNNHYSLN